MNRRVLLLLIFCFPFAGRAETARSPLPQPGNGAESATTGIVAKSAGSPGASLQLADGNMVTLASVSQWRNTRGREPLADRRLPLRVHLGGGEFLLGSFPEVTQDRLDLETPFGSRRIPRDRISRMVNDLAGIPVLSDSFATLHPRWITQGDPVLSPARFGSSPSSLLLDRPGVRLTWNAESPLVAGNLSLVFYDPGTIHVGRHWRIALRFGQEADRIVAFEGGWRGPSYLVDFPKSLEVASVPMARRIGWHRLVVSFGPRRLLVTLDDGALVSSFHRGLELPLAQVELSVREEPRDESPRPNNPTLTGEPSAWIDDLLLVEAFEQTPAPLRDPDQTMIVDRMGDQWMGELLPSSGRDFSFRLATGTVESFRWNEIQAIEFADASAGKTTLDSKVDVWNGEVGEIEFAGGRIVAELMAADEREWSLRHPILGPLVVATESVRSWVPLVVGARRVVFPHHFHLGKKVVHEFSRPMPDGEVFTVDFDFETPMEESAVRLTILGMEGIGPRAPFAARLEAGQMVSELWINGRKVDSLNRYVEDRSVEPAAIRVPVPKGMLRQGANRLEIRQTPDSVTGYFDEAEISRVAIENTQGNKEVPSSE